MTALALLLETGPSMLLGWNVHLRECGQLGLRVTHTIEDRR
jgi:hypothetical protein